MTEPAQAQDARFLRAQQAFGSPRFRALYRAWLGKGRPCSMTRDHPCWLTRSLTVPGQVEWHVLAHRYLHLSSLVGTA